ncbi:SCO6745 family protein [Streptomyces griseoluteus]|uniref:SCO6745 family protein n=1 Tax=Streptomyces griseoluteus TaxID=29306 RepID=UPI003701C762
MADVLSGATPREWPRLMWELYEPVHDIVYFAPQARQAADKAGMRGFWMGYFGMRAAPLGPVGPAVVTSCFYVFHPDRVARAVPDAWRYASPCDLLAARERAVDGAMRQLFGDQVVTDPQIAEAADLAWQAAMAADTAGRVLGAANQAIERPAQPHIRLWQALTTLREHRGDGHIAVLVGRGIGPLAALVLKAAAGESDGTALREGRKWDLGAWQTTEAELRARGQLDAHGRLTAAGAAEHVRIEDETDAAAARPWQALGKDATERLGELLRPLADQVAGSGLLPAGNPVGLTGTRLGGTPGAAPDRLP